MSNQCDVCLTVIDTPAGVYNGHPLCADCYAKHLGYEAAVTARADRLKERAARKADEAVQTNARAEEMAGVIPMGQPILVGHHSEGRDRRYRAKIDRTFRRAFEARQEAQRLEARAQAAQGNDRIDADDPLAVVKLADRLAELEAYQARMKQVNRIARGKDQDAARTKLLSLGLSEAQAARLLTPDFGGHVGYAPYQLRNNNANMRRIKQRIAALREQQAAVSEESTTEQIESGVEVVRNHEENRLQLIFDGKPDADVRAHLKANGWRWAPSQGAWQRHLNANSEYALTVFKRFLDER